MLTTVFVLICIGLIGAGLFTAGIVISMSVLVVVGISLIALSIIGMILKYVFSPKPTITNVHNPIPYTTNNMNTMKRNKSDTDLELINRQSAENEDNIV